MVHRNGEELKIRKTNGATFGINIIKHIKFFSGAFLSPFIGVNYNINNLKKISADLDNDSKGLSFGLLIKTIDTKYLAQNTSSKHKKPPPPPF
jgi:hypothetical protein